MKKTVFILGVLLLSILGLYGCANIIKESSNNKISASNDGWNKFSNEEIEAAKKVAIEYYKNKNLPNNIDSIEYNANPDKSLAAYKNSNCIIFLVNTKDEDKCIQVRTIVLSLKDKNWEVITEGL